MGVNGGATHVYHGYARDFVGYNAFTHIIRNYSAVTAACLATRRSIITEVGGFDEMFATDYNDIDLCLKIPQAGYRIAYTPYAELYHFESASIKRTEQNAAEVARFKGKWASVLARDPYYNPNLTRSGLDFADADVS
jgi:GT2 family glycosyltransferase